MYIRNHWNSQNTIIWIKFSDAWRRFHIKHFQIAVKWFRSIRSNRIQFLFLMMLSLKSRVWFEIFSVGVGIKASIVCTLKLLKHLLRENANFLILFRQDSLSLKHIFEDHVNPDMSYQKFLQLCKICWKDKHDFIVIAKDYPLNDWRYRKGFNTFNL